MKDEFTYTVAKCDDLQCSNGVWHSKGDSWTNLQCKRRATVTIEGMPFCTTHAGMFIANGIAQGYKDGEPYEFIDTRRHEA